MIFSGSKKNSASGGVVIKTMILLVIVGVVASVFYILQSGTGGIAYAKEYIVAIQNYTAEAKVAKSLGDDIIAGRSNQSMTIVQGKIQKVQNGLSELKVPEELKDYKNSVGAWADEMDKATSLQTYNLQKKAWKNIPTSPKNASVKLNKDQAKQSLHAGIQHVATARQFGNYAISTANTEAMRSVSARLFAQGYWFKVLYQAYPGDICADNGCLSVVWGEVPILQGAASSFVERAPDANDKWEDAWNGIVNDINPVGVPITGAGISQGQSGQPPIPKVVQTFFDSCKTSGGLVDDTGGVKEGLPTTDGGWTCWEPRKQCWHYLTYSGWLFVNGGPQPQACPKIDLSEFVIEGQTLGGAASLTEVPEDEEESKSPIDQPATASWDGVYQVSYNPYSCTEGATPAIPQDTITVSNNKIASNNNWGIISSTPIDAAGKSVVVYSGSGEGYSEISTDTYTFSRETNGQTTVSVSWVSQVSATIEGNSRTGTCNGTGGGQRIR